MLSALVFYTRNVENLTFEDVRMTCTREDQRPMMICDRVERLTCDGLRFPRFDAAPDLLVLNDVSRVRLHDTAIPLVQPACIGLAPAAGRQSHPPHQRRAGAAAAVTGGL